MLQPLPWGDPWFTGHVVAFGVSALACFATLPRIGRIDAAAVRRGLAAFVGASGVWAAANLGYVVAAPGLKVPVYTVGLVVGFATVFAWLYFCSAYCGRSLHRNRGLRAAGLGLLLVVSVVKFTNPWHHAYFTTTVAAEPFAHVAIRHGTLHWIAMGLAYVLAALGYFMLFELFSEVGQDTRPLAALLGLFALPVALNVASLHSPALLEVAYEPLGVAAFAVGVTVVYHARFRTVQLAGERGEPTIVLTEDGHVRDYNARAVELFPALGEPGVLGAPLADSLPALAAHVESDESVFTTACGGEQRAFSVRSNPFASGSTPLGRLLLFEDVTERERYRRELERQNERLERFASVLSHDLRNPLTVAKGHVDILREDGDDEHLEATATALDRMDRLVTDVLALARQGRSIDAVEPVALDALAAESWELVDTTGATLETTAVTVEADRDRLQQLLENLFRNAVTHGGAAVTVSVGPLDGGAGFHVADDGVGIPAEDRDEVFDSGFSTDRDGTGFGLAIVAEIAEAHGWVIDLTESAAGGARFEFRTDG